MKKVIALCVLFLCMCGSAFGISYMTRNTVLGATAVTATWAQTSVMMPEQEIKWALNCKIVDADVSISALAIKLQGTLFPASVADASAVWSDIISSTATVSFAAEAVDKPYQRVRINVVSHTGLAAANDNITCWFTGVPQ